MTNEVEQLLIDPLVIWPSFVQCLFKCFAFLLLVICLSHSPLVLHMFWTHILITCTNCEYVLLLGRLYFHRLNVVFWLVEVLKFYITLIYHFFHFTISIFCIFKKLLLTPSSQRCSSIFLLTCNIFAVSKILLRQCPTLSPMHLEH